MFIWFSKKSYQKVMGTGMSRCKSAPDMTASVEHHGQILEGKVEPTDVKKRVRFGNDVEKVIYRYTGVDIADETPPPPRVIPDTVIPTSPSIEAVKETILSIKTDLDQTLANNSSADIKKIHKVLMDQRFGGGSRSISSQNLNLRPIMDTIIIDTVRVVSIESPDRIHVHILYKHREHSMNIYYYDETMSAMELLGKYREYLNEQTVYYLENRVLKKSTT